MNIPISRRDFIRWSALAGAVPLLAPRVLGFEDSSPQPAPRAQVDEIVPKTFLHHGLRALGNAHRFRWAAGHHGAAVLAGYYLCRENPLDERALRAVRKNLDDYIASQPEIFAGAAEPKGAPAPADRIVETFAEHASELRGAAHDAIFTGLAVKALRDAPEAAVAPTVDGVCELLRGFVRNFSPDTNDFLQRDPPPPYASDEAMIEATFAALERPHAHLAARGVVGVIHWVTHADALVTLSECGWPEVARRGYRAHQTFIHHPVTEPADAPDPEARPASKWLAAEYWESEDPRRPLGRTWLNGHTLKFPFSLFRLAQRCDKPAIARGLDRAPWLVAEFERQRGEK